MVKSADFNTCDSCIPTLGLQGPKGDKGDIGPMGPQGLKGDKGEKGDKGDQGPVGPQGGRGAQGPEGPRGPQGLQGEQGIQGPKGDQGDRGLPGIQGPQGERGEKGDQGEQGSQGPQGIQGIKGDQGPQGIRGPKGDKGDKGERGIQGIPGPKGCIGPVGPKGDRGNDGDTLEVIRKNNNRNGDAVFELVTTNHEGTSKVTEITVPKGPRGDSIQVLDKGLDDNGDRVVEFISTNSEGVDTKAQVSIPKGEQGLQGPRGLQGERGVPGPAGEHGLQGLQGPQGEPGKDGDTLTFEQKEFDEDGNAVFEVQAHSYDGSVKSYEIVVPKGAKGDKGDPGRDGDQFSFNSKGLDDNGNLVIEAVITGGDGSIEKQQFHIPPGPQGPVGPAGDSIAINPRGHDDDGNAVFDVVVTDHTGYQRTFTLTAPKGEKGDKGERGETGPQGAAGTMGLTGAIGPQGPKGDKGEKGDKGDTGAIGPQGPVGAIGPAGPAGRDGRDGRDGANGTNGKSAYELAVERGYRGDLNSWLNSLNAQVIDYTADKGVKLVGSNFSADLYNAKTNGLKLLGNKLASHPSQAIRIVRFAYNTFADNYPTDSDMTAFSNLYLHYTGDAMALTVSDTGEIQLSGSDRVSSMTITITPTTNAQYIKSMKVLMSSPDALYGAQLHQVESAVWENGSLTIKIKNLWFGIPMVVPIATVMDTVPFEDKVPYDFDFEGRVVVDHNPPHELTYTSQAFSGWISTKNDGDGHRNYSGKTIPLG